MTRGKWVTNKTCKMYELKYRIVDNDKVDVRVDMFGKVFRSFKGQNKFNDAIRFWNNIESINS